MTTMQILLNDELAEEYLTDPSLIEGNVPMEAVLLQLDGTETGQPTVMIAFRLPDGSRVVGKTSFALLEAAVRGIAAQVRT